MKPTCQERLRAAALHALTSVPGLRTPLLVVDRAAIRHQIALWRRCLPDVAPFYAMKANSHAAVLQTMAAADVGFDAATGGELDQLQDLEIEPERVLFTHPIRDQHDLAAAARLRPGALVVQDADEIDKLAAMGVPGPGYAPILLLRVALPFSNLNKFGARILSPWLDGERPTWRIQADVMLQVFAHAAAIERSRGARYGGFGLAGHVGTNCTDVGHWRVMLALFRVLAAQAAAAGQPLCMVDLGGGFCDQATAAARSTTQEQVLRAIGAAVAEFRQACPDIRLVAEPGRFLVADAAALVTTVKSVQRLGWRTDAAGEHVECDHLEVHIDDGIYGCLMGQAHDDKVWEVEVLRPRERGAAGPFLPAHIWGATCDTYDRIEGWRPLPADLVVGDRLLVPGAGAYTLATRTAFNAAVAPMVWCVPDVVSPPA